MSLWQLAACIAGHNAANRASDSSRPAGPRAPSPDEFRDRLKRLG